MENKTEKKMTYAGAIDFVLEKYGEELPTEIVEKFDKLKEQLNKKKSGVSAKKMEENKEVIREIFLTAATNILTENGIDGTIDTLTYRKIKFECNKRPVVIGINVDERFIFC